MRWLLNFDMGVVALAMACRFLLPPHTLLTFRYGLMSDATEEDTPREVEIQLEIMSIKDNTQKHLRYLELTAKRTNSIALTIPRRRWFHSKGEPCR
jgi:hypothetical protein